MIVWWQSFCIYLIDIQIVSMFGDSLSLEKFFFGIHFEYKTQIIAYWSKIKITLEKTCVKIYRWFICLLSSSIYLLLTPSIYGASGACETWIKENMWRKMASRNLYVAIFLLCANNLSTNFIIFVLHYRIIREIKSLMFIMIWLNFSKFRR